MEVKDIHRALLLTARVRMCVVGLLVGHVELVRLVVPAGRPAVRSVHCADTLYKWIRFSEECMLVSSTESEGHGWGPKGSCTGQSGTGRKLLQCRGAPLGDERKLKAVHRRVLLDGDALGAVREQKARC